MKLWDYLKKGDMKLMNFFPDFFEDFFFAWITINAFQEKKQPASILLFYWLFLLYISTIKLLTKWFSKYSWFPLILCISLIKIFYIF